MASNVALSGDNAVVVGMAAAGLPAPMRRKAIAIGIGAATLLRVVFAVFTVQLLEVVGLLMVGGLLLLWVSWKLWKETQEARAKLAAESADMSAEERSEEHTSELQSLMRISYAVFCLQKKYNQYENNQQPQHV